MKKILIVSLAVIMILTSVPFAGFVGFDLGFSANAALAVSGKCGDSVNWKYDEKSKTLTVYGEGEMWNFDEHRPEYFADPDTVVEKVIIEKGITKIGNYAFSSDKIKSVTIADTVTVIGDDAFDNASFTSIKLPSGLTELGDGVFCDCKKLKKITLPDSLQKIGVSLFSFCDSLTEINFGNGSFEISGEVTFGSGKMGKVTIGKNAKFDSKQYGYFFNIASSFVVHKDNEYLSSDENGVIYNKDKTVLLAYPIFNKAESFTVPSTVKKINRFAFSGTKYLNNVTMTSVEEIGYEAFAESSVQKVSLGDKLRKIGTDPFFSCDKLSEITLPSSLTEFTDSSFNNHIKYKTAKNHPALYSKDGNLFSKDKTVIYTYYYKNKAESYTVPDTVKKISVSAFESTEYLKSVKLPSGLEEIGDCAFYESALTSVTIPKSVKTVAYAAFESSKLKKLTFQKGSKAELCDYAFGGCESLNSISVPSTVTKLGYGVFDGIGYIMKLEDEGYEGPVYIGNILYCIAGYGSTAKITVKDGTTSIAEGAFGFDTVSVKIPASVEFISEEAFSSSSSLVSIDLNKNNKHFIFENNTLFTKDKTRILKYIGSIFQTSYTVPDTVETIDTGAFDMGFLLSKVDFGSCPMKGISIDSFSETKWYQSLPKNEVIYINNVAVGTTWDYTTYPSVIVIKEGTVGVNSAVTDSYYADAIILPDSVTYFDGYAEDIYYTGTIEGWNSIEKSDDYDDAENGYRFNLVCDFEKDNHNHVFYKKVVTENSCSRKGENLYTCPCGESYKETTEKVAHYAVGYSYEKPATFKSSGKKVLYCDMCEKKLLTKTVAKIASIELKKNKFTYTGKYIEPEVAIKDTDGNIIEDCYFTVPITDCKKIGTHKVTVYLDDYLCSGTKTLSFDILPGKTDELTATQSSSAVKLSWNKVKDATGYRVYKYNTKTNKYEKVGDTTALTYTVKKLKSGTDVKFAVKAYTKVSKKTYWASSYTTISTTTKPAAPSVKLTAGSKKVTVSWNKVTGATGYAVYMMNADGKYEKLTVTKELKYVKTKLKKGKAYSFRVRAYKKFDGKYIYSSYKTYTVKAK